MLIDVSYDCALKTLGGLMRERRQSLGMSLTLAAQAAGTSKGHLSHVEAGRDRPSRELVMFYEEHFNADGQIWTAYVDAITGPPASVTGSVELVRDDDEKRGGPLCQGVVRHLPLSNH